MGGQTEILDLLRVSGSNWKRMQILESKGVNQSGDESLFAFPVSVQKVTLRTWHNHRSVSSIFPVSRSKEQRFQVVFCFSTISSYCIFPLFEWPTRLWDALYHRGISDMEMIDLLFTARDLAWDHQPYYCTAVVARAGKIEQRIVKTTVCFSPSISAAFIELTGL